jgi:hypothetical protein
LLLLRRWLPLLIVGLCGCVRLGYSPDDDGRTMSDHGPAIDAPSPFDRGGDVDSQVTTGDSTATDAAPPPDLPPDSGPPPSCANLPDGTPCDDQDICTSSSTCQNGVCTGSGGSSPCTVANSKSEYGHVQGEKGWWYGFWNAEDDLDGTYDHKTDFQNMVIFGGNSEWRPPDHQTNPTWCYLDEYWEHPSADPRRLPVRRWISDVSGPAVIQPEFNMSDTNGGDGTKKTVLVDGVQIWSQIAGGSDPTVYTAQLQVLLEVGTVVDFVLDPLAGQAMDTSNFEVTVVSP